MSATASTNALPPVRLGPRACPHRFLLAGRRCGRVLLHICSVPTMGALRTTAATRCWRGAQFISMQETPHARHIRSKLQTSLQHPLSAAPRSLVPQQHLQWPCSSKSSRSSHQYVARSAVQSSFTGVLPPKMWRLRDPLAVVQSVSWLSSNTTISLQQSLAHQLMCVWYSDSRAVSLAADRQAANGDQWKNKHQLDPAPGS